MRHENISTQTLKIMKTRLILTIVAIASAVSACAQRYEVTKDGLRDATSAEKSYLVLEAPGKTAEQLFKSAQKYIIQTFKNPDYVKKGDIDGEYLRFDTYTDRITMIKTNLVKLIYSGEYSVELGFKDGKVKYEVINLKIETDGTPLNWQKQGMLDGWWIFGKRGEVDQPTTKKEIEDYFASRVIELKQFLLATNVAEDDW